VNHLEHCAALADEITRCSGVFEASDPLAPVPTCPGWTVSDVAAHLGEVHRWAERLVRERAQVRVPSGDMDLDGGPASPSWLLRGGADLLSTLRANDPDSEMWAWGADQHVRFWSRRQLHETTIHRIDMELAMAVDPDVEVAVARDGIDEFLANLPLAAKFSPGVQELKGDGAHVGFTEVDGGRRWVIRLDPDGISFGRRDERSDAELRAGALDLLLILYGRRSLQASAVTSTGDPGLLRFWLDHSALE
jgi:uncharacterized protein (TIGR03083 family)